MRSRRTDGCAGAAFTGATTTRASQPPRPASSTGLLLKSFGGLTSVIRFENDELRVIVTVERIK